MNPLVVSVPQGGTHFALELILGVGKTPKFIHAEEVSVRTVLELEALGAPIVMPRRNPFDVFYSRYRRKPMPAGITNQEIVNRCETMIDQLAHQVAVHTFLARQCWRPFEFAVDIKPEVPRDFMFDLCKYVGGAQQLNSFILFSEWKRSGWKNYTSDAPPWPLPYGMHERLERMAIDQGYSAPKEWPTRFFIHVDQLPEGFGTPNRGFPVAELGLKIQRPYA